LQHSFVLKKMLPVPLTFGGAGAEEAEDEHTAGNNSAAAAAMPVSPDTELAAFALFPPLCFCAPLSPPIPPPLPGRDPWCSSYGSSELCSMPNDASTTEEELRSLTSRSLSPAPVSEDKLLALF
jgi:hypothetical protein